LIFQANTVKCPPRKKEEAAMKRVSMVTTIGVAILSLSGCGTMLNFTSREKPEIYGGVEVDVAWIGMSRQNPAPSPDQANLLGIVDLPFSFIGDTLTLPITLLVNKK
jgi:uncharacterized protein YceK